MTNQLTGEQLRDQGYSDVLAADASIARGTRKHIERGLDELIALGLPFTADDLHAWLGDDVQPHSVNLVPALFGTYRCAGRIVPTGWVTSTRPSRHAAAVRVWIAAPAQEAA